MANKTLDEILALQSVDLNNYEIRGAKPGLNNARTTGTVYVSGSYYPGTNVLHGTGYFDSTSITSLTIDSPYSSLNANDFRALDIISVNSNPFTVSSVQSNAVILGESPGLTGTYAFDTTWINREYLVEPDIGNNNINSGTALFTLGSPTVVGDGTSWLTDLTASDIIKSAGYQTNYRIASVTNDILLTLTTNYGGDTTTSAYNAKRVDIGRALVQYTKNDAFEYNTESSYWEYDAITDSSIATSLQFSPLVDGINLKFSKANKSGAVDLMDSNVALNTIIARQTQYDSFQFPLPAVPYPESTLQLKINNIVKLRYPEGHNYIVSYSQNPVYTLPPPVADRRVANLMFLKRVSDQTALTSVSEYGSFQLMDGIVTPSTPNGSPVNEVLRGSEVIEIDGTVQIPYRDYVIEPNTGTLTIVDSTVGEPLTKYIAANLSDSIDYGISVYLNGKKQQLSFPASPADDVIFQPLTGRLKPQTQAYPGPGDIYTVNYEVNGTPVEDENLEDVADGQTSYQVNTYPLKRGTISIVKSGTVLEEDVDFRVSHRTGTILLTDALQSTDSVITSYTPLSIQQNELTRSDGTSYCTVRDSRLIKTGSTFQFQLQNSKLANASVDLLRVYNESREKEYSLNDFQLSGTSIVLGSDASNLAIGTGPNDIVVADYRYRNELTEYKPVYISNFQVSAGVQDVYVENVDLTNEIAVGGILRLGTVESAATYFFIIDAVSLSGSDTKISLRTTVPEQLINPTVHTVDSVVFETLPVLSDSITTQAIGITFQGVNLYPYLRTNTLLKIDDDIYAVAGTAYDGTATTVNLTSEAVRDYAAGTTVYYSDCPLYAEGDLELYSKNPIVVSENQSGMLMSVSTTDVHMINSNTTDFVIDTSSYDYATYPTMSLISSAIQTDFPNIAITTYVPDWSSSKIVPLDATMHNENPLTVYVYPALRADGTDVSFSVSDSGSVILNSGLVKGQFYELDYMGQQYLGDSSVGYSIDQFSMLPKKSKLTISMQYLNLDQFYVQAMSQREFIETVTIPRMDEEAQMLSGNLSQGGDIPSDTASGNSQGGIANDEYKRKDAEIECNAYKNIYDFFSDRLNYYNQEYYAFAGFKMFNNDGTFSEEQQQASTLSYNRMFPIPDYTGIAVYRANPVCGEFSNTGAKFINGHRDVTCISRQSLWTKQLRLDGTPYIGVWNSDKRYRVTSIVNDASLVMAVPFAEKTTSKKGIRYNASVAFPIYDDDGHLGAKTIGTVNNDFGLEDGDLFDATINGKQLQSYFRDPSDYFMKLFYPVSNLSGSDIARQLSTDLTSNVTYGPSLDIEDSYGLSSSIIIRTRYPDNTVQLGYGSAVEKLGFTPGLIVTGNIDRTASGSEMVLLQQERGYLTQDIATNEISRLVTLSSLTNILDRTSPASLADVNIIYNSAGSELGLVTAQQIKLNQELQGLNSQLSEIGQQVYSDSSATTGIARLNVLQALADNTVAINIDSALYTGWEGKGGDWQWAINFTPNTDSVSSPAINGQTSFVLQAPNSNDFILQSFPYGPTIVYADTLSAVPGLWSGWDPSVGSEYSINDQITFTMSSGLLFGIKPDSILVTSGNYTVDQTALNMWWVYNSTAYAQTFRYATYTTIGSMKTAISAALGWDASGPASYNALNSESFVIASGNLLPDATMYSALRSSNIAYNTINSEYIDNRTAYVLDRDSTVGGRYNYLAARENQIRQRILTEGVLRDTDGSTGDLYAWADARFNRRQGCNARLSQIEKQIESNLSAQKVNNRIR